jgi:hypothetical protein
MLGVHVAPVSAPRRTMCLFEEEVFPAVSLVFQYTQFVQFAGVDEGALGNKSQNFIGIRNLI